MTFIKTIPEQAATGATAEMYATDRAAFGHLPNFTRAFSHRPAVYAAWRELNGEIKSSMDLRRYELATVAAATRLRSSYCTLAHGSVLVDRFFDADSVKAIVADHRRAGKTLDALGVEPDAKYADLDPDLRETLTVGRAIVQADAALDRRGQLGPSRRPASFWNVMR